MIAAIVILIVGLLLAAAAVLLRKKLGVAWMCSIIVAGMLTAVCGGVFCYNQYQHDQQEKQDLYLGLRYLEQRQLESANYYLKKVDAAENFVSAAARGVLNMLRGSDLTARMNLDIAASQARKGEQKDLVDMARNISASDYNSVSLLISQLIRQLGLSETKQANLDLFVRAETGGNLSEEELAALGLSENDQRRMTISALLRSGSYEAAVRSAVSLVDSRASEENRLLLAETVAESAYYGMSLSAWTFAKESDDGEIEDDPSVQSERETLQAQWEKLEEDLLMLDIKIIGARNDAELQSLNQQKLELTEEIQALRRRADKLYVYRAFNAIADLSSLHAQLVRARLYFALMDYDKAVETLLDAAGSLQAKMSLDQNLTNSLRIVANAYESNTVFYESAQFQDAMTDLLSAPFSDLMYFNQCRLTQDFAQRIISDQKTYGRSLNVGAVDASNFPTVRVSLAGREEVLREVVEGRTVVSRDTRQTITYRAVMTDGTTADICMLLDRSGSMGGEPMQNLHAAVSDFVSNMQDGTSLSLVAFDNGSQRITDLTGDRASLLAAVDSIYAGGGTNITAGIQEGIEVLRSAGSNRVMLLMTDGQSSIDYDVVDEAAALGITIYTVGFGSVNDGLLREIAERTGGQYVRADSASELSNVYASLQQIIGNIVTLEYTVTDPEVIERRYFFLQVGEYSVHRDYTVPDGEATLAQIYNCSPAFTTPEQLRQLADRNRTLDLDLTGEGLHRVQSVTVGGLAATINSQYSDRLRVSVPASLHEGWQTVELTLIDDSVVTFDQLLLVGETYNFRNIRLGNLFIASAQGVLPGDGTLVLAGNNISIREDVSDNRASSLDLSFTGALVLPWTWTPPAPEIPEVPETPETPDEPEEGEEPGEDAEPGEDEAAEPEEPAEPAQPEEPVFTVPNELDLGDQGTIIGYGTVTVNRNDGAYHQNAPTTVASGWMVFACGPDQSRLIMGREAH